MTPGGSLFGLKHAPGELGIAARRDHYLPELLLPIPSARVALEGYVGHSHNRRMVLGGVIEE
jgi:hypothetical protein